MPPVRGASAGHRTAYGETLLFAAATSPYDAPAKIRLLGQAGVGVNARAADGSTALMIAVQRFWTPGLVEALLALRADLRFKNSAGQTVLDLLDAQEKQTPSPSEYDAVRGLLQTR
jgi:ankyrin repeat protein